MTGTVQAQVILADDELRIEYGGNQTVKLDQYGNLYLGGDGMYGNILSYRGTDGQVLYFNAGLADLTIGGASSGTPQAGDVILKDDDGLSTTIELLGQYGHIRLGGVGSNEDGDITVLMGDGTHSFEVDGASGNVTNQSKGNGLVKAWARINDDGTVASCWRCDTGTSNTQRLSQGRYEVDFNFASNIRSRPRSATIDTHNTNNITGAMITVADRDGDTSTVYVVTSGPTAVGPVVHSYPFTLVIY